MCFCIKNADNRQNLTLKHIAIEMNDCITKTIVQMMATLIYCTFQYQYNQYLKITNTI